MRGGVVTPGEGNSARIVEMPLPVPEQGEVLVRMLEVGIDGTDMDISQGRYGEAPPGEEYLVLGHEVLGVVETGSCGLAEGDLVVPLVRRPGGCVNCQSGRADMCIDGDYRESGIKGRHGFLREHVAEHPHSLVKVSEGLRGVAVLTEPVSIVTKGLEQAFGFHKRSGAAIEVALVLGAGSLGLLATALLRLGGLNAHTLDVVPRSGLKAQLAEALGASYIDGRETPLAELPARLGNLDLIFEATGNSTVAFQAMSVLGVNGVLCLAGVSTGESRLEVCADCINLELVLGNKAVFGTVSSNRGHFERAIGHLGGIEGRWPGWLSRLITRRLTLDDFVGSLQPTADGIKTVVEIA